MQCGTYHHSTNMSFELMNKKMSDFANIGIHDLLYFNLFEYGQNVTWPLPENTNGPDKNTWQNASEFLWFYLNDSISYNYKYEKVGEWQYGILLDPDPKTLWGQWLINQSIKRIEIFGNNFNGISIDRQDHTREYNYNYSDDLSLCINNEKTQYIECKSLLTSWKNFAVKLTDIIHNNTNMSNNDDYNPIITHNYAGGFRMDLNMISDIIFSEFYDVSAMGLSSMMKPSILWTYSNTELQNDGIHQYFQKSLYLNVALMAPCIGNDHSILPDSNIQIYYNMYGKLFKMLRGAIWWLQPQTVNIIDNPINGPLINPYIKMDDNDMINQLIIVLVLGDMKNNQSINVNVVGMNKLNECQYVTPSDNNNWKQLIITNNTIVNNIKLNYGCAVVKCVP